MRTIKRMDKPPCLDAAILENLEWESFRGNDRDCFDQLKIQLKQEQLGLCCYCETSIVEDTNRHIEHIKPKKLSMELHLDYENLAISCNGGISLNPKTKNGNSAKHCGHYKDIHKKLDWSDGLFSSPHHPDTQRLFIFTLEGKVEASGFDKKKADYMIDYLGLNATTLIEDRKSLIDNLLNTNEKLRNNEPSEPTEKNLDSIIKKISIYLEPDQYGFLPAYYSAAKQLYSDSK